MSKMRAVLFLLNLALGSIKSAAGQTKQRRILPGGPVSRLGLLAGCWCAASGQAATISVAGNDTLVGNRLANLIVNGSFEADGGLAPNNGYWATGTTFSPSMSLSGWTASGPGGSSQFPVDGFFGLNITGESVLYLAAPSGNGPTGPSQRYQVYFTPTASTLTFRWINWGHYFDPNGLSNELVLDDVILNEIPEPTTLALLALGALGLVVRLRKR